MPTQRTRLPRNMIMTRMTALDPARIRLRMRSKLPEAEAPGTLPEDPPEQPEGTREHEREDHHEGHRSRAPAAQDEERNRRGGDRGGRSQQGGVRAVAGEVLPDRELQARQGAKSRARCEHHAPLVTP